MKRLTILFATLLLTLGVAAQNSYNDNFTQTRLIKVSSKSIVKNGRLIFDGKDNLTMNYTNPEGEYFIVEGNNVKMNLNGKKNVVKADKAKSVGLLCSTLLNCLSGNWEEAAKANNAQSTVTEGKGTRTVTLTANGKVQRGGYASVVLTYRTSTGKLTKMVLEESSGIVTTYEIVP